MEQAQNNFQTLLRVYRQALTPVQRKHTRNLKPRAMPYPIAIERSYSRYIANFTKDFIAETWKILTPFLVQWAPHKTDSIDSDLDDVMTQLKEYIAVYYGTTYLTASMGTIITNIAESILGKNSNFFEAQVKIRAGVPISIDRPWWPETRALWEQQNFSLIKGMGEKFVQDLNTTIINSIQSGASYDEIVVSIDKLSEGLAGWRSRLLARYQIGKLNGMITKNQYQSIGMETYYWMTSQDERVRGNPAGKFPKAIPSHWIMQGLLCAWNNAMVYYDTAAKEWLQKTGKMETTHPGFAIACRCIAAASWNTYLKKIDEGMI